MGDFRKLPGLLLIGLAAAVLIYPVLHEMGHVLTTVLWGGRVVQLQLRPPASVLCCFSSVNTDGQVIAGLGGMLLPFLLTISVRPTGISGRLICLYMQGICALSFLISAVSALLFLCGRSFPGEDMTGVLRLQPHCGDLYLAGSLLLTAISAADFAIVKELDAAWAHSAHQNRMALVIQWYRWYRRRREK